ncbi:cell division protein PerM [Marinitenerispora sediminis]
MTTLVTLTLIGWVAAPHATFGEDIGDVFRVAVQAWLVGNHAGFAIPGGHVGLLPIGLLVLPGLLLYRSGRWLARSCHLPRLRHVFQAALALAGPYAAISGTLALVGQTEVVRPSMVQALASGFLLASVAGGLGVLRQLLKDKEIPWSRLLGIMPARPRSLLVGTLSATSTLLVSGALLFFAALLMSMREAVDVTQELAPGPVGGALLLVIQLLYLPNAVIFAMSYTVGPGFTVGADTIVAPTGVALGPLPQLPMLAALPESGAAPVASLVALAAPFVAGGVGGALTLRSAPTVVSEAAPLWGLVCGVTTGLACAGLSVLAGGSIGAERLAEVGPSAWQVGLITALEVGVSAAVVAWVANWLSFRPPAMPVYRPAPDKVRRSRSAASGGAPAELSGRLARAARRVPRPRAAAAADPDAPHGGDRGGDGAVPKPRPTEGGRRERRRPAAAVTAWWSRRRGGQDLDEDDAAGLFGISYEAGVGDAADRADGDEEAVSGDGGAAAADSPDRPASARTTRLKRLRFDDGASITFLSRRESGPETGADG